MQFDNFKRIVTTFADEETEMAWDSDGTLLLGIRGIEIEVKINQTTDGIQVEQDGAKWSAKKWIFLHLAKLDRLADRIISSVDPPEHYVSPNGKIVKWKSQTEQEYRNAQQELLCQLSKPPVGTTAIYFLTSNAGEGKTSLIGKISVDQAKAFKEKRVQSLILPIPLGGAPFLRLDDAVIASLSNKFRFPFLYYDSFLELVKMGVIIPAFDGYEEMLAETTSGEAISAIGDLINQLSSHGTLLVAARKAYFDSSLKFQAKLLDPVRSHRDVEIYQFELDRWSKEVFLRYAEKRNISSPEKLYHKVAGRLNNKHPVLTRAVLVRRLLDVAEEENDLDQFLRRLGESPTDYFFDFVESIVDREVTLKWIDSSGTGKPLLTKDEHHELLSLIAFEMWINGVESIGTDIVRLVIQIFSEENNKIPNILRQINHRINDHSLLHLDHSAGSARRIRFDHEDFQAFYLGQALARALNSRDDSNAKLILDARQLPDPVIKETARYLTKSKTSTLSPKEIIKNLHQLTRGQADVSYVRENCGALMLELVERTNDSHLIKGVIFPSNALKQRKLKNLKVLDSLFNPTEFSESIQNCTFLNCRFVGLSLNGKKNLNGTIFEDCSFDSVTIENDSDKEYQKFFTPDQVRAVLINNGFKLKSQQKIIRESSYPVTMDRDMKIALNFIRMFARSTAVDKNAARHRIGKQANYFFSTILPELQRIKLIVPTGNRFRLVIPLSEIDELVEKSGNTFKHFISNVPSS
ncbi:MAG: hypothetical protein OXE92_09155 [Bacteroidetes bacterium]|nr:hypothetical protein [Bacteroidota bacterium]